MRKLCVLLAALVLCMLCACGGEVSGAELTAGPSELYSVEELCRAMGVVTEHFEQEFDHCKLLTLVYDEAVSQRSADGWARQYGADEAIVLKSSFYVGKSGGGLEANETYEGWQWILTRSGNGEWTLRTWGYG